MARTAPASAPFGYYCVSRIDVARSPSGFRTVSRDRARRPRGLVRRRGSAHGTTRPPACPSDVRVDSRACCIRREQARCGCSDHPGVTRSIDAAAAPPARVVRLSPITRLTRGRARAPAAGGHPTAHVGRSPLADRTSGGCGDPSNPRDRRQRASRRPAGSGRGGPPRVTSRGDAPGPDLFLPNRPTVQAHAGIVSRAAGRDFSGGVRRIAAAPPLGRSHPRSLAMLECRLESRTCYLQSETPQGGAFTESGVPECANIFRIESEPLAALTFVGQAPMPVLAAAT